MRPKVLLTGGLILLFFLGEIAVSFSYKKENDRNVPFSEIVPLSYKISNNLVDTAFSKQFDGVINNFVAHNEIIGASLALAKNGRLVYAKGYGYANLEDSIPVSSYHLFRIASVSKLITAVTIMKLIEDEKLSKSSKVFGPDGILNDSIYLQYVDNRVEDITVHQLLNHSAGWNVNMSDPVFNSLYVARKRKIAPPAEIEDVIQYALDHKLSYTPGTKYKYSNLGYTVLGQIIEKITGMNYEEYVQFAILHPLGIYDMHIGRSYEEDAYINEVKYYNHTKASNIWAFDGSKKLVPVIYGGNNVELLGAAGGWVASAPELVKLMVAIDGFESRPDILSQESIGYMTYSRGLSRKLIGWRGTDGYGTWWRTGTMSGTSALIMRHKNEVNWVMLVNTSTRKKSKIHNDISRTMFQALRSVDKWPVNDMFNIEPEPGDDELAELP
ncbi:MAG: beta-lactamase family protein [Bacteroidales bacterium]|nr:beta-lactamase family protein [Bacteroidales bacterium]MBN2819461.1 beta-lactamase family protein [Bacteroidales bacterium]